VLLLISIVPIFYLVSVVDHCRVDVPFGDQWDFIPLLEKSYQGEVSFADLTAQHNEHRLLFPRIIMLSLAHLTSWRISAELYTIVLIAIAMFVVFSFQLRSTIKQYKTSNLVWALPVISLIVFSFNQWENWVWGWQVQILLSVFSVVSGFVLLSAPDTRRWKFITAVFLGIVAIYSFANGILYWIIGLAVLCLKPAHRYTRKNGKWFDLGIWSISACLVVLSFMINYRAPANHPSMWSFLNQPLEYVQYVFKYIGGALAGPKGAFWVGAAGILIYILILGWFLYSKLDFQIILPYVAISLYSIGSAMLSGIGRIGFGSDQAMSPRYATFSNLFWVVLVVMFFLLIENMESGVIEGILRTSRSLNKTIVYSILFIIVGLAVRHSYLGTFYAIERKTYLTPARTELLKEENQDDELLKRLYPPGAFMVKDKMPILKRLKTSVFRK
jgi:hypothetical protein